MWTFALLENWVPIIKKDSVHHIKDSVHMFQFDKPYLEHEYQVIILYYI